MDIGVSQMTLREWSLVVKQAFPVIKLVYSKTKWFLFVIFFVSTVATYWFSPKRYYKEYTLLQTPLIGSKISVTELSSWNQYLEDYLKAQPVFKNSFFDELSYGFERTQYSTIIKITFSDNKLISIAEKNILTSIKSYKSFAPKYLIIRSLSDTISLNYYNFLYSILFSIILIAIIFAVLLIKYAFNDTIYYLNKFVEHNFIVLGLLPFSEELNKDVGRGPFWETMRTVYSAFTNIQLQNMKVIQFTSSVAREGKTTIALSFAKTAAHFGKKVIILDCDLRKPQLHLRLPLSYSPGMSDYLIGSTTIDQIIFPTEFHNLWAIPSGPIPPNPVELLEAPPFKELIIYLRANFDLIILDSPPLLVSDATFIAKSVDLISMIFSFEYSKFENVKHAVSKFKNINNNVFFIGNRESGTNVLGYWFDFGFEYGYGYGYVQNEETPRKISYRKRLFQKLKDLFRWKQ